MAEISATICRIVLSGLSDLRLWGAVLVGAAFTAMAAIFGLDAWVNDLARLQNGPFSIAWSAFPMVAGMVLPVLIPLIFLLQKRKEEAIMTGSAFLLALLLVSLLKGLTSRVHPEALEPATSLLRSQAFRFGLLQDGFSSIVEGWPSGHTATNGAVGLTLARLNTSRLVHHLALAWVVWVALATVFGINGDVHWLSDTVAGFFICLAITHVVADRWRDHD